jgi:hypothetical protein
MRAGRKIVSVVVSSIRLNDFPPLARTDQRSADASNRLPPKPRREIMGRELVHTRRRPAGLPHRLTGQPVADNRKRRGWDLHIHDGRGRSPDAQSFVQLLGSLFARRERHVCTRGGGTGRSRTGNRSGRRSRVAVVCPCGIDGIARVSRGTFDGDDRKGLGYCCAESQRNGASLGGSRRGRVAFGKGWGDAFGGRRGDFDARRSGASGAIDPAEDRVVVSATAPGDCSVGFGRDGRAIVRREITKRGATADDGSAAGSRRYRMHLFTFGPGETADSARAKLATESGGHGQLIGAGSTELGLELLDLVGSTHLSAHCGSTQIEGAVGGTSGSGRGGGETGAPVLLMLGLGLGDHFGL